MLILQPKAATNKKRGAWLADGSRCASLTIHGI